MALSKLTASTRRLALVGLAKNTGKTETLATLLRELASSPQGEAEGRRVGVTSVGRDGEQHDVIDARIAKPRIELAGESLVATTDTLLRASGLPHELLERMDVRTPLGRVLIARLRGRGAIEVAGPSAAADVRAVSDAMLAHGAEQILIDGAIDRRAASSPDVADGLVIATGAVLSSDVEQVVRRTADAVELARLPAIGNERELDRRLRTLAAAASPMSVLVGEDLEPAPLPPRFALTADGGQIAALLDAHPHARSLLLVGALPERFLAGLAQAAARRRRELLLVIADPTKAFLSEHPPAWYRAQGVELRALRSVALLAVTVNPVAPESHRFASERLTGMLREAILDVPVFDVRDPGYPRIAA